MFNLTPWQEYCLVRCYHEGRSEAEVAGWHGVSRAAVAKAIRQAGDKLACQGLPRPKPYGRGSRAELRAILPEAAHVLTQPPIGDPSDEDLATQRWLAAAGCAGEN